MNDGNAENDKLNSGNENEPEKEENYMVLGMAVGLALGAAFSLLVMKTVIYAPLGMLFGLIIGSGIKKKS